MSKTLSLDEHVGVQNRISLIGQAALGMITDEELEAFIDAGEHADTLGPFLDPTLWQKGHAQLRMVLDHARALVEYRRVLRDE